MWSQVGLTTKKADGGDGIPPELFQILKDDAVKVLYSVSQQIWKTQQWPQDWKRSVLKKKKKNDKKKEILFVGISEASTPLLICFLFWQEQTDL